MGRRSKYSSIFKAQVALAGLRGDETMQSLAKRYEVSPSKITEWMRELEEKAAQAFEKPSDSTKDLKKI
ncbi:transposase, partial [Porphyromonas levii]